MSGIEVLIAGIGFCSSVVPYVSSYVLKRVMKQRKLKQKLTDLYIHPFFKFINEYIIHSPYNYVGENIYENIYLSMYYSIILENIYALIGDCVIEKDEENDFIQRLSDIVTFNLDYVNFNTVIKTKNELYIKHSQYFLNINNFEAIKERVDSFRSTSLLKNILDNVDTYNFDKVNDKINFLIMFLKIYNEMIKKEVENIRDQRIISDDRKLPKYNILFEIDDLGNICYYNKSYCHLIDYLNSKIINKNIIDINIIQDEDKMKDFVNNNKRIKTKVKRSLLDNFFDLCIYTKVVNGRKYILMNKEITNMFPKSSPSCASKLINSPLKLSDSKNEQS